jgi:hypothetical protein
MPAVLAAQPAADRHAGRECYPRRGLPRLAEPRLLRAPRRGLAHSRLGSPPSKTKLDAWRKAGAKPADRPRTYFRLEAVFAADQVDPLPPPADPAPLDPPSAEITGDSLAWALQPLDELAAALGYAVVEEALTEGHGGSCDYKASVITINAAWSVNARVSVRCHEIGHALVRADHQDDDPELDYAAGELVAESVAHLACSFLGLDSSAAAIPYLAGWAEAADPDSFEQIAGLVDRLARRLENALGAEDQAEAVADVEASPAPAGERPLALAVS